MINERVRVQVREARIEEVSGKEERWQSLQSSVVRKGDSIRGEKVKELLCWGGNLIVHVKGCGEEEN